MITDYKFEGGIKTLLISFMIIGIVSMGLTFLWDDEFHSRFWSNYLINSVFFTGIAFVAFLIMCGMYIAYSGWQTVFKRIWEGYSLFLIIGLVLMLVLVLGNFLGLHHLYHWNAHGISDLGDPHYDEIIAGKSGFLNNWWYGIGTVLILLVWYFFAHKIRTLSVQEDHQGTGAYSIHKSIKKWAAIFLPIGGFTSAALIWLWVMSVDSHWYSTLFAWYATISWFVSMLALTILTLIFLKSKGYMPYITAEHMHDLGKYMFAFSIFWTYLWFSQFMLIWYGNIGEETIYFRHRMDNYPFMFYAVLVINFLVPFFVLMRNDTKRKAGTLAFVAIFVFLGHWMDFFLMIKPGVLHTAHEASSAHSSDHGTADHGHDTSEALMHSDGHDIAGHSVEHGSEFVSGFTMPGLLEIGTMLGFFGLFMFFALNAMTKASLLPKNDPYLGESLHHHV